MFGFSCACHGVYAEETTQLQSQKNTAYRKFHNGQAAEAARDIRQLVTQTNDAAGKVPLLRDLVEMCATALEWPCAVQAEIEAFELIRANPKLKPYFSELYSYLIKSFVWQHNDAAVEDYIKNGGVGSLTLASPAVAAELHLALHSYYIRKNNQKSAEAAYSAAVLSLLLIEPNNKYAISKILIGMLDALMESQDAAGAVQLFELIDPFLANYLNRNGLPWANIATQLPS